MKLTGVGCGKRGSLVCQLHRSLCHSCLARAVLHDCWKPRLGSVCVWGGGGQGVGGREEMELGVGDCRKGGRGVEFVNGAGGGSVSNCHSRSSEIDAALQRQCA